MKAKTVFYQKLVNIGHFQHEKFGVEIELEDGENAQVAMDKAKEFINKQINPEEDLTPF